MHIFAQKYVVQLITVAFMSKELLGILCGLPNSSGLLRKTSQEEERMQTDEITTPCRLFLIKFYDP
jgi:hypothetical protein